jgi:(2Fe-2S) ferredoxin
MSYPQKKFVMVCKHTSCMVQGASKVFLAFQMADLPDNVIVMESGCQGQCSTSPTVRILPEETWYFRVKSSDVERIVEEHLKGGEPVQELLNPRIHAHWE